MNRERNKRAWWCDICHVPLLNNHCLCCGSKGRDICSATLVPVFRPEIQYLKKQIDPEIHPFLKEGETWISPRNCTYYCQGVPIAKLTAVDGKAKSVEVGFSDQAMRINYLIKKYRLLFQQRVEKQLKKLQVCIFCGACGAKCKVKALNADGTFQIDDRKCNSCLSCLKFKCPVVKLLHYKGLN